MSSQNYTLDFSQKCPPEVQARIADGMQRSEDHADTFWKAILAHCIWEAARKKAELTVDDVLDQMEIVNQERVSKNQPPIDTHDMSALGPAMRSAAKQGIIVATLVRRRSTRPKKHGNLHTVWKSNFFSGAKQ